MAKARILVVDDEGIVAMDISARLQSLGYRVCGRAASGEEAISKAAADRPDLVLMDIKLKGQVDGVEAALYIRSRLGLGVIFLTAFADEATLERAKMAEPYGYIIKPFEERDLQTAVEMALYKHQAETRLKQSEQWLAVTLRSIGDAVVATDERGQIKLMNPAAEALTGWPQGEAALVNPAEVIRIIDRKTESVVENPVAAVLRDRAAIELDPQIELLARDGRELPIACSAAPIRDDHDCVIGAVLVLRDLTAQRRLEEEMLKNQKLESIGVLAGGIAHDFNNLLTPILGNIGLVKMIAGAGGDVTELLTKAEKACRSAQALTKQLLTFARGGAPVKTITHISRLVQEAAQFAISGSNVRCEFHISDDLWPVEVDDGLLRQVIINLVINAEQAMPDGGTIRLSCDNATAHPAHELPLAAGQYVQITVTDRGVGIAAEHIPRIFDPYFTTKKSGRGLGLTVAHSIIRDHGGHIEVSSELGGGTTFSVYLPAAVGQQTSPPPTKAEWVKGAGRVLIMDDEDAVRDITGRILTAAGYEVAFAADGAQAIELYRSASESDTPFDAVIMDLTVPGGMGGQQAIEELRKLDPQVKAIVSSGYSADPILADHQRYGFRAALSKPFEAEQMCATVRSVITGEAE